MPKANKLLVPLLVLAHLCAQGVLLALRQSGDLENADLARGLLFAEVPLVAMWLAWGRTNAIVRMFAVAGLLFVAGFLFKAYDPYQFSNNGYPSGPGARINKFDGSETAIIKSAVSAAMFLVLIVGVPLALTRAAGVMVLQESEFAEYMANSARLRRWQISIWQLLMLMTAVGLAIPVVQYADFSWMHNPYSVQQGAIVALATLACALVMLGYQRLAIALPALFLVALVEYRMHGYLSRHTFGRPTFSGGLVMAQMLGVAVTILVVRLAGYRLYWPSKISAREPASCA